MWNLTPSSFIGPIIPKLGNIQGYYYNNGYLCKKIGFNEYFKIPYTKNHYDIWKSTIGNPDHDYIKNGWKIKVINNKEHFFNRDNQWEPCTWRDGHLRVNNPEYMGPNRPQPYIGSNPSSNFPSNSNAKVISYLSNRPGILIFVGLVLAIVILIFIAQCVGICTIICGLPHFSIPTILDFPQKIEVISNIICCFPIINDSSTVVCG